MRLALVLLLAAVLLSGCAQPAPVANRAQPTPEAPIPGVVGGATGTAGGLIPRVPTAAAL